MDSAGYLQRKMQDLVAGQVAVSQQMHGLAARIAQCLHATGSCAACAGSPTVCPTCYAPVAQMTATLSQLQGHLNRLAQESHITMVQAQHLAAYPEVDVHTECDTEALRRLWAEYGSELCENCRERGQGTICRRCTALIGTLNPCECGNARYVHPNGNISRRCQTCSQLKANTPYSHESKRARRRRGRRAAQH